MNYQVIIVGAGPTGLTLANILGMHGVRTLIVERNPATVNEPRAVSIDDESLRTMQYIGILDEVRSKTIQGYGSHYFSASANCFTKVLPTTMQYGFPRRSAFRQPILEAQLRTGLQRFATVTTLFSTNVREVSQDENQASVHLQYADGHEEELSAEYVIACDGGKSPIREALKIPMSGSTYNERWLIIDLVGSTDRFRHTRVFCDPSRPGLSLPGPDGTRRYEFMMLPGESEETLLSEKTVRHLLAKYSDEDSNLEITRKVIYHFHARLADKWRVGRVFLAGDAAHLTPPFAGQGMNSGVRDAQNLGWKLARVVRGDLEPSVMDSYELERRDHAHALIQMAVRMGHIMMPRSRTKALLTQMAFRALNFYKPARDYVIQMKYKPQPRFEAGFVVGRDAPKLRGRMFPQPVIEHRNGHQELLDEVLGHGFSILLWEDGFEQPDVSNLVKMLDAKVVNVIPNNHRFVPDTPSKELQVRDWTGEIGDSFAMNRIRGVIIRPDRYVAAGIGDAASVTEIESALYRLVRNHYGSPPRAAPDRTFDLAFNMGER